jgi:hypothetical protein
MTRAWPMAALILVAATATASGGEPWNQPAFKRAYDRQRQEIADSRTDELWQWLQEMLDTVAADGSHANTTSYAPLVDRFQAVLLRSLQEGLRCPAARGRPILPAAAMALLQGARETGLAMPADTHAQLSAVLTALLERTRAPVCKARRLKELAS